MGVGSTSTAQIEVRIRRSAPGVGSAEKAMVRPSADHAMSATPQSPAVTWRGTAPRIASTTNRCDQRSRWPASSQRQSARRIRRATGVGSSAFAAPFRCLRPEASTGGTVPTRKRGGSTSAVKASRLPSGDQASSPTAPYPRRRTAWGRASARRRSSTNAAAGSSSFVGSPRTNATRLPSGESRGRPSRMIPPVSWRGRPVRPLRPPSTGMAYRWLT